MVSDYHENFFIVVHFNQDGINEVKRNVYLFHYNCLQY